MTLGYSSGQGAGSAIVAFVLLVVFLFAFVMVNMWGDTLLDEFTTEFSNENYTAEAQTALAVTSNTYGGGIDSIGMLVLVGLWILSLVLAYNSSSHPMLGVLTVILVGIIGLVGMLLSNSWDEISTDADFSSAASSFPMLDWVLDHYLVFVLVIGFTVAIAFFMGASQS